MKISELISVSIKDGTVVFTSKDDNTSVGVIGCSCILAKKSRVSFDRTPIVVRPPSNAKVTVIGLIIGYNQDKEVFINCTFIGINLKDKILYADLDKHYTFDGGTISFGDRFPVVITLEDGRKFAPYTESFPKGIDPIEGFQLVENPDLLFQFAAGVIDLETLESYATADKRTAERVEIVKLRQRITLLETELEEKTLTIADLRLESRRDGDARSGLENRVSDLLKSVDGLRKTLDETYIERDGCAKNAISLKQENSRFKASIRRVKRCVFGSWMPWIFPWGVVSACRGIVSGYKDKDLE